MLTEYKALTKTHSNSAVFVTEDYSSDWYELMEHEAAKMFAHCTYRAWKKTTAFPVGLTRREEPACVPQTLLEYAALGLPYRLYETEPWLLR